MGVRTLKRVRVGYQHSVDAMDMGKRRDAHLVQHEQHQQAQSSYYFYRLFHVLLTTVYSEFSGGKDTNYFHFCPNKNS